MTASDTSAPGTGTTNIPSTGEARGKRRIGPMARREMRLAHTMLLPTFFIVFAIVLFPLLANFWISVKPVTLSDLRPPTALVSERVRGDLDVAGEPFRIQYRIRNSSQSEIITNVAIADDLPAGIEVTELDERCTLAGTALTCDVGTLDAAARDTIELIGIAGADFAAAPVSPRDSEPLVTGDAENILTNNKFTMENFARVFDGREFWSVFWVTIGYTIGGTLGALVLGLFAAQLMSTSFYGRSIVRGLFLFPYVAPVIAVAFTWVLLLDPFSGTFNALLERMSITEDGVNFLGTRAVDFNFLGLTISFPLALATVIAFEAWRYFPLAFLFILARMQSIPSDMYEAAEVDGATPMQQFWHISLPQLISIMSTLFLLRFIWTFNKFDDIFLLTGGAAGTRTLTVDVYERGFALSNLGAGAAVAVVIFLFLLVFSVSYFVFVHREEG